MVAQSQELPELTFHTQFVGREFLFHSTWGLFSPTDVDNGSRMLVESINIVPDERILDIGCGYGAIGIPLAAQCPGGTVHMIDKDFVAVEYAKRNAEENHMVNCETYLSNLFSNVPRKDFSLIVSNVPAKVGNVFLSHLVSGSQDFLVPSGRLIIVAIAGLREFFKREFMNTFSNYEKLRQGKTYAVVQAVKRN